MRREGSSLRTFQRMPYSGTGTRSVTSNISTKFLPGILIGYAADVTIDPDHLTQSGYLIPVADFDNLQEVLIIDGYQRIQEEADCPVDSMQR